MSQFTSELPLSAFSNYLLLERLSQGVGSDLHCAIRADGAEHSRLIALKRISPDLSRLERIAERWTQAAQRAAQLSHPGCCRIYEFGKAEGSLFVAMELIAGMDLGRVLARLHERNQFMPALLTAWVMSNVASALDAAHSRRNGEPPVYFGGGLTPSNIVIGFDGSVKLIDFGMGATLASTRSEPRQSQPSPDLAGAGRDARSDLFALGGCLLGMLGGLDHAAPRQTAVLPRHDALLRHIALRAREQRPEQRLPSAAAVRQALDEFMAARGLGVSAAALGAWMRQEFQAEWLARQNFEARMEARIQSGASVNSKLQLVASTMPPPARSRPGESGFQSLGKPTPLPPPISSQRPAAKVSTELVRSQRAPSGKVPPPSRFDQSDPNKTPPRGFLAERLAAEMVDQLGWDADPTIVGPTPQRPSQPSSSKRPASTPAEALRETMLLSNETPLWPVSYKPGSRVRWGRVLLAVIGVGALLGGGLYATGKWPQAEKQVVKATAKPAQPDLGTQQPQPVQKPEPAGAGATELAPQRPDTADRPAHRAPPTAAQRSSKPRKAPQRSAPTRGEERDRSDSNEEPPAPTPLPEAATSEELAAARASLSDPAVARGPSPNSAVGSPTPSDNAAPSPAASAQPAASVATATATPAIAAQPIQISEASPILQEAPRFPARARRRGVRSGNVSISFNVDRSGVVQSATVLRAEPAGVFDDAALEAVRKWTYHPKLENGTPVEARDMRVRLLFSDGN